MNKDPFESSTGNTKISNDYNVKAIPITTFSGERVSIPKYDCFPKYIERFEKIDMKIPELIPPKPIEEINVSETNLINEYTPKTYTDLISDERTNRQVLEWMRHFQNAKSERKKPKRTKKLVDLTKNSKFEQPTIQLSHILLLAGPPGSGKTTLIRIIAKHCGFHTVELNASDDASVDRNQMILQNQLNFEPVFGAKTKPLMVFEELDGIGTISDSVLKAITGNASRPVVIIVNDGYAQSLKNIRSIATFIKLPPPNSTQFKERIRYICKNEEIDISTQAINEVAEISKYDIRTALNTISFLRARQPISADTVHLLPVGLKNSSLTPFDVWTTLFTASKSFKDCANEVEIFGNTRLISTGILENLENIRNADPTRKRLVEMFDNLCYADVLGDSEASDMVIASCSKLCGVQNVGRNIAFPTSSLGFEGSMRSTANSSMLKNPMFRTGIDVYRRILCLPQEQINYVINRQGESLRKRITAMHQCITISYKKNAFGHYTSVPDVDNIIGLNNFSINNLTKYRECIQTEIESQGSLLKELSITGTRIQDKLGKSQRRDPIRNFWGEEMDLTQTQETQRNTGGLKFTYNEGFTNAVRRKVLVQRILMV